MATDVKLDQVDGTFLQLEGRVVKMVGSDFMIDSPDRRTTQTPFRRALVHGQGDALVVNFAGDYPAGIILNNVSSVIPQPLPKTQFALVNSTPVLAVHGDISYEVQGISAVLGQGATRITLSLTGEINKLNSLVAALTERVAALEAKIK